MTWLAAVALVGLVAGLGGMVVARDRRYRRLFAIDLASDQVPAFAADAGSVIGCAIEVDRQGFVWPEALPAGSLVMEVEVASTAVGRWFDPWLELQMPDGSRRSYVERGARGRRLVHFGSGCRAVPGQRVELRARGLRWRNGSARLWAAPALPRDVGPTLIVAPHSDDAELAAFSLFGEQTWVVTVTAGEVGTYRLPGYAPGSAEEAWARAVRRARDSVAAARAGGVPASQVVLLGYFDGSLADLRRAPDRRVASSAMPERRLAETRELHGSAIPLAASGGDWGSLVRDLQMVLRQVRPARIVLPHPDLDLHADHVAATLACLEAADALAGDQPPHDLLYYANHRYGARDGRNPQPVGRADGVTPIGWAPKVEEPLYDHPASIPLTFDQQVRKRQVLRGMVDLLPAEPVRRGFAAGLRRMLGACLHATITYDLCFLRRNVRPDELYFVVESGRVATHRRRLLQRFAHWRGGSG